MTGDAWHFELPEDCQLRTSLNALEFIACAIRKLANIIMSTESCLYSQWFEGNENCVADSLSCDFHIPDFHLQHLLCSTFPLQVPFGLKILPLPTEIVSWLMSLLLKQL